MTIGINMKCKDGIVIATDSQSTLGDAPYKTLQATKIEQIGKNAAIVNSGPSMFCNEISRKLKKYAKDTGTTAIPDLVSKFSMITSNDYRRYMSEFNKQKIEDIIRMLPAFSLLSGIDDEDKHIFRIEPPGVFGPIRYWDVIGSGTFYSGMIVESEYNHEFDLQRGVKLVVKAIKETKGKDPYVGGPTQLAVITKNGFEEYELEKIEELEKQLDWEKKLHRSLDELLYSKPETLDQRIQDLVSTVKSRHYE